MNIYDKYYTDKNNLLNDKEIKEDNHNNIFKKDLTPKHKTSKNEI